MFGSSQLMSSCLVGKPRSSAFLHERLSLGFIALAPGSAGIAAKKHGLQFCGPLVGSEARALVWYSVVLSGFQIGGPF